jgi:putative endonuclease
MPSPPWFVYLLYSVSTGRIYTGISTDPQRRLQEHNGQGTRGAKATRAGRPWHIARVERCESRSEALQREREIKGLPKKVKLLLAGLAA